MATEAPAQPKQKRSIRKMRNRAVAQCMDDASRYLAGKPLDPIDPADALQFVLNRGVALLAYASERVDTLPEDELYISTPFGPVECAWLVMEEKLRKEVGYTAARMVDIGIADRAVQLEEAKAALFVRAVMEAAREAGISRDKIKQLGPAIRVQLELLSGEAVAA